MDAVRPPTQAEKARAVGLFFATLLCVYWVYGTQWMSGDPFTDPEVAWGSAKFAAALMSILLAHEMGHYIVARRHGFALSLPYFIPFPAAVGTFGAIIRLQSPPKNRTALLEMGAAGPIAGFVVAVACIVVGLPGTQAKTLEDVEAEMARQYTAEVLAEQDLGERSLLERVNDRIEDGTEWIVERPPISWLVDQPDQPTRVAGIMHNPPIMDVLGRWVLGREPGRYDRLDPLAVAGWMGCLLTAINLIPIGQLDGGHIANALSSRVAARLAYPLMVGALVAGFLLWTGWAFWALLIYFIGADRGLQRVPHRPPLSRRARLIAGIAFATFLLSFMPRPVELEHIVIPPELLPPQAEAP